MYLLYILGQMLEPAIGRVRFAVLYFVALLAGSFGALLLSPDVHTVGASGAVFGLMGAAVVMMRAAGSTPWQSGIGGLIVFNLGFTFTARRDLDRRAHRRADRRRAAACCWSCARRQAAGPAAQALLADRGRAVVAAIAVAGGTAGVTRSRSPGSSQRS